jgi:hypothetical protein
MLPILIDHSEEFLSMVRLQEAKRDGLVNDTTEHLRALQFMSRLRNDPLI